MLSPRLPQPGPPCIADRLRPTVFGEPEALPDLGAGQPDHLQLQHLARTA